MKYMQSSTIRCHICGKKIVGTYYQDWAGHVSCTFHPIINCASCGLFCDDKAINVGAESKICSYCQKFRIERKDCDKIVNFLQEFFSKTPIGTIKGWHLVMISPDALFWKTRERDTRGLAEAIGSDYTIYIYRDLSRVAFARTLAHEMLHVYQYKHCFHPERSKSEGFCNVGAYLILESIGNKEAIAAMSNMNADKDPIYGSGFRYMKRIYEECGWVGLIKEISTKITEN